MDKFYSVIKTGLYGVDGQWFFRNEENARNKFNEVANEIKDQWGYNEEDENDSWTITDNKVEMYDHDYGGDDDFHDCVEITVVKFED